MNAALRLETDLIRSDQRKVHSLVTELDRRIDLVCRQMDREHAPETPKPEPPKPQAPPPLPVTPPSLPVLRVPLPPPEQEQEQEQEREREPVPEADGASLELRFGTYWMPRIGIAILLTGLVFLGNYAYHRFIGLLGPWGKLALLALAGGLLAGAGAWMERSRENLRNFGRVLLGGGAAAIYYTVYAAHFVERLRVIDSPLLGGALLLLLAGGIAWFAERRRSETVAVAAILLSYYTSAINPIGAFTLWSNLILTAGAVFLLVRNRWTKLSVLSLVATYGSYGFWRIHQFAQFGTTDSLGMGLVFLAGYWVIFTAAVFLLPPGTWRGVKRAGFLSLNNGAFFFFGTDHFAVHRPAEFWWFASGLGMVLLGLAALAARRHEEESAMDGAYLAQGLLLVTVGFAAKLTGPQLAMVFAVESAALLACVRRRHGLLYELGAGLCAFGAFVLTLVQIYAFHEPPLALGAPVAAVLLFNVWWAKSMRGELVGREFSRRGLFFSLLGCLLAGVVIREAVPMEWRPLVFSLAAVAGWGAARLALTELTLLAQGFAVMAAGLVITAFAANHGVPIWSVAVVFGTLLAHTHWWRAAKDVAEEELRGYAQVGFAGLAVAVAGYWIQATFHGEAWLVAMSVASLVALGYGLSTRLWAVALAGQVFTALAAVGTVLSFLTGHPYWLAALAPVAALRIAGMLIGLFGSFRWNASGPSLATAAQAYRILAAMLFAAWALEYVPASERAAFFAAFGAAQIAAGGWWQNRYQIIAGVIYAAAGLMLFWLRWTIGTTGFELLGIVAVPAAVRWAATRTEFVEGVRESLVVAALASVWLWVTRWTMAHGDATLLTVAWTVLAFVVLGAGLGLRERIYRLGGFIILGLTLGWLFLVDVWRFETLARIVSFLVLGGVLLVLSFVYNRFAETLRKWL